MADKNRQLLVHLHTAEVKAPSVGLLEKGELAIQYAASAPVIYIEKSDDTIAKFIDEVAVDAKVSVANSAVTELSGAVKTLYATSADTVAAIEAEKTRAEGIEEGFGERIDAIEAISAETRLAAVEAVSAGTRLDVLETSAHTHDNKDILDGIDAERVAAWDASGSDAKDYIDGVLSAYTKTTGMTEAIATAKDEAIGEASAYTDGKLEAYATSADTHAAIEAVDGKFANYATSADTHAAVEAAKTAATTALEAYATSADTHAAIEAVDGKFADYATSADTHAAIEAVDGKFANYATSADTHAAIEAAKDARVDTLVGEDAEMSVREIAADEASKAAAAIVSGAPEAFDTLKDIADWIGSGDVENTTAAQMVTDIEAIKAVSADTRLASLEAKFDGEDSVDAKISAAKDEAIGEASAYTDGKLEAYATSADTHAAIEAVDGKFADYATSADTHAAVEAAKTAATTALESYATSADTVAAIEAVDGKFADYATSADTHAAIEAVDGKFANYATSADTHAAVEAAKTAATTALEAYATSADTVAAIEAVDGKFADYATSADTHAAIEAVDGKFADYATSADTHAAIEAAVLSSVTAATGDTVVEATVEDKTVKVSASEATVASLALADSSLQGIAEDKDSGVVVDDDNKLDFSLLKIDCGTY